ncbi:hypothetical protein LYNGBM3L_21270 [Moorena producens 3L]|uniref:Uncharacterized protein n=1 Tax=Moorena producens 3L TaxID=489825 RepID=F4XN66_9CYAN|nr:hypothetical protein LYNGBM3L_21270 [Moorena producens 3L]
MARSNCPEIKHDSLIALIPIGLTKFSWVRPPNPPNMGGTTEKVPQVWGI